MHNASKNNFADHHISLCVANVFGADAAVHVRCGAHYCACGKIKITMQWKKNRQQKWNKKQKYIKKKTYCPAANDCDSRQLSVCRASATMHERRAVQLVVLRWAGFAKRATTKLLRRQLLLCVCFTAQIAPILTVRYTATCLIAWDHEPQASCRLPQVHN